MTKLFTEVLPRRRVRTTARDGRHYCVGSINSCAAKLSHTTTTSVSGYPFYVWKGIFRLVHSEMIVQLRPGQGRRGILRVIVRLTHKLLRLAVRKHKVLVIRNIRELGVFPSNHNDLRRFPYRTEGLSLLVKHTYKEPTNSSFQNSVIIVAGGGSIVYLFISLVSNEQTCSPIGSTSELLQLHRFILSHHEMSVNCRRENKNRYAYCQEHSP